MSWLQSGLEGCGCELAADRGCGCELAADRGCGWELGLEREGVAVSWLQTEGAEGMAGSWEEDPSPTKLLMCCGSGTLMQDSMSKSPL